MPMKREQGTCTGRGFSDTDAEGWCAKFKAWVVKTPANGGPGWYIIADKSTQPVAKNVTGVDTTTEVITVPGHGFSHGEPIRFATTGTQISGITTGTKYYAWVIDADSFKICTSWQTWMSGTFVNLSSAGSSVTVIMFGPYIVVSDKANPSGQDNAKILKVGYESTISGYITCQSFMSKGVGSNSHPAGVWSGYFTKTVDAGPFTYDFRGNSEFLLLQTRIPAEAKWYRFLIDEWAPLVEFCEDDALVNGVVANDVAYTAGADVILTLQNSSQVSALTKGQGYFVYFAGADTNGNEVVKCHYGVIDQKGTADGLLDTQIRLVKVGACSGTSTVMAGSRISPYWHRTYTTARYESSIDRQLQDFSYAYSSTQYKVEQPYYSYSGAASFGVMHQQSSYIRSESKLSAEIDLVNKPAQDNGLYIVQKPAIHEVQTSNAIYSTNINRVWGECKNLFLTNQTGMTDMETGRTINAKDYVSIGAGIDLYEGSTSNIHVLIQHTESES
jgi:hypothetical protein